MPPPPAANLFQRQLFTETKSLTYSDALYASCLSTVTNIGESVPSFQAMSLPANANATPIVIGGMTWTSSGGLTITVGNTVGLQVQTTTTKVSADAHVPRALYLGTNKTWRIVLDSSSKLCFQFLEAGTYVNKMTVSSN